MTPKSFDLATAKEYLGDERTRLFESIARKDAETLNYRALEVTDLGSTTYMVQVRESMAYTVYHEAYRTRVARNERKAKL